MFFPSDELCNFHDSHGSVLDSQHYIHPWTQYVTSMQLRFHEISMRLSISRRNSKQEKTHIFLVFRINIFYASTLLKIV